MTVECWRLISFSKSEQPMISDQTTTDDDADIKMDVYWQVNAL